jgi:hypothetical protein
MSAPDQAPEPDRGDATPNDGSPPAETGVGRPECTGSPAQSVDEASAQDELLGVQDAALGSPSQQSLLRLLGWRPGDPYFDQDDLADIGSSDDAPDGDGAGDADGQPDRSSLFGVSPANISRADTGVSQAGSSSDVALMPEPEPEPEPVVPINWNTLDADRAEQEWWQLDAFVYWLRDAFGLTPQELPPLWHRHTELVWELSALRTAWLAAHAEDAHPGSPLMWLRDLSDSRRRLRDWVQRCGTTLTEDRPTRRTAWPGEEAATGPVPAAITDREADFGVFVTDNVARRRRIEAEALAEVEELRAQRLRRLRETWGLPRTSDNPTQDGDRREAGSTDEAGTS